MAGIALLVPHIAPGDAVSRDMLGMAEVLRRAGHEVELFAAKREVPESVHSPAKLRNFARGPEDVLIYHYAIAWEEGLDIFQHFPGKKIIKYHNVTPPEFFDPYHAGIANACRAGLAMFPEFIRAEPDLYLGVSDFNRRDMIAMGAPEERTGVVAPFHDIPGLLALAPDLDFLFRYSQPFPRPRSVFLMLGRIVPNKGYEDLLRVFAFYREHYDERARLILAGKHDPSLASYNRELDDLILELRLGESVVFTGGIPPARLKSCYLSADVFITLSRHEGFCVPLLEAMAFRIPILALEAGAMPETAGEAALTFPASDPETFALALHRLVSEENIARALTDRGRERYLSLFTNEKIGADFLRELERVF